MKTMKYFVLMALFFLSSVACDGREKNIKFKELPVAAQTFLKDHFDSQRISLIRKDSEGLRTTYDVILADGTKLDFDSKGEWTEVDSKPAAVPATVVPQPIADYVKKNYPNAAIVQIERDGRGYEVDLSIRIEVRFDSKFNVKRIDD